MNYIFLVDNKPEIRCILKSLLYNELKQQNYKNYKIASWNGFDAENTNVESEANQFCESMKEFWENKENTFHIIIDLLLTREEEENISSLSKQLLVNNDTGNYIASGIKFANIILQRFNQRIRISFMSKWVDLQNEASILHYNGISENNLWNEITIRSLFSPINENNVIINKQLAVPKYDAKTLVDVFFKVAFGFDKENDDE